MWWLIGIVFVFMFFVPILLCLAVAGIILLCIEIVEKKDYSIEKVIILVFVFVSLASIKLMGQRVIMVNNIVMVIPAMYFTVSAIEYLINQ